MEQELSLNKELSLLKELLEVESVPLDSELNTQLNFIFDKLSTNTNTSVWSNTKIQPILMRLFLLFDSKIFSSSSYYPKFCTEIKTLISNFISNSPLASKFFTQLKVFFSKKKFSKFSNLLSFLSQYELAIKSFRESIEKEVLKDVEGLEKKQEYLSNGVVNYLSKNIIVTKINPFVQKMLRKSMKNLSKIRIWLKKIDSENFSENSEIYYLILIIESNIVDAINKEESLQNEFFNFVEILLKNFSRCFSKNEQIEKAIIKFLTNMNSKLKSKRIDSLMVKLSNTFSLVKGNQSDKIIKEIIDGHLIASANVKGEDEKQIVLKNFNKLLEIKNQKSLFKYLSSQLKDKKNVSLVAQVIFHLCEQLNLNTLKIDKANQTVAYRFNEQVFETENDLYKNFMELWNSFKQSCGQESSSIIKATSDTVPITLANVSSLIFNSYFCLLNETEINEINFDELNQNNIDDISPNHQNYESAQKIIKILFKNNSLLFRKSFTDDLNDLESLLLLKIIYFTRVNLTEHIKENKIDSNYTLLLYSLITKVLLSNHSNKLFLRGKLKKMISRAKLTKKLPIVSLLFKNHPNSLVFTTNLINDDCVKTLIEGSFIHLTGKKYNLNNQINSKNLLKLFIQEQKNIFEICRKSSTNIKSDFNISLQLIVFLSLCEYDNVSLPSMKMLKSVTHIKNDKDDKLLDLLTDNNSRIFSHKNSSILLGSLEELFNGQLEDILDLFLNRLCTNLALFEQNYTIKNFMKNLLTFLMLHDSKNILQRLNWFLSDNNLSKLNRMKKILNVIEMKDLDFEAEEQNQMEEVSLHIHFVLSSFGGIGFSYDSLKEFGFSEISNLEKLSEDKQFPSINDFEENKEDLFEKCAELHILQNEEEEMNELELNSQKENIIIKYFHIIDSVNSLMKNLVDMSSLLENDEKDTFSQNFITIQNSVKTIIENEKNYLASVTDTLFLNILSLTCLQNNVSIILSQYYNILTGNEDSIFMVKVEQTAEKLLPESSFFSEHLFPIFFKILKFIVEFNLSAQAKKNLLEIVVQFTSHFEKYTSEVYQYIADNLNSFYFDLSFKKIESILVANIANSSGMNHLDVLCNNLIMYEEYAREQALDIIKRNLEVIKTSFTRQISPLNKLKLMFLSRDEDSGVTETTLKIIQIEVNKLIPRT